MKQSSNQASRAQLRKQLRQKRRSLSPVQQKVASLKLAHHLFSNQQIRRAHRIAVYLAGDGEIDPQVFAQQARKRRKQIYLPSLHPVRKGHLWFGRLESKRKKNGFGIWEPSPRFEAMRLSHQLDVVLMPLVGFDLSGARLGMGGGFYDRTFAFKQVHPTAKPCLMGLAHHFQQVDQLPIEPWDVPLTAIITDQKQHLIKRNVGSV